MKKTLSFVLACLLTISSIAVLSSCTSFAIYKEINSIDDLYAMQANGSYKLMCDLDLENQSWTPINVINFDGNGHTISNCLITEEFQDDYGYQAFFSRAKNVKNLTMSNINVIATNARNIGVVVASNNINQAAEHGSNFTMENITVKHSTITVSYSGASGDNLQQYILNCGFVIGDVRFKGSINDCHVEDSKLQVVTDTIFTQVGGIVGGMGYSGNTLDVANCYVEDCSLSVTQSAKYKEVNMGGIFGGYQYSSKLSISDCYVNNSELKTESTSERQTRIGGIVGNLVSEKNYKTEITLCQSSNNLIYANTKYGYNIGGVVGRNVLGKIDNCYSLSNELKGQIVQNSSDIGAYLGGVIGTSDGNIIRTLSCDNNLIGTNLTNKNHICGGFVASQDGSVTNCSVRNNSVAGYNSDVFSCANDAVFNSVIYDKGETSPNCNLIPVKLDDEWEYVINLLDLDKTKWKFDGTRNKLYLYVIGD